MNVLGRLAAVVEDIGLLAARIFPCVGQDGQGVEVASLANEPSQVPDIPTIRVYPVQIDADGIRRPPDIQKDGRLLVLLRPETDVPGPNCRALKTVDAASQGGFVTAASM